MIKNKVPIYGEITSEQYTWWERGARAEHEAIHEGMTEDNRQLFDYVEAMAQQGYSVDRMADSVAIVFTCEWPLRKRLALAWEIMKPLKRRNPFRRWLR